MARAEIAHTGGVGFNRKYDMYCHSKLYQTFWIIGETPKHKMRFCVAVLISQNCWSTAAIAATDIVKFCSKTFITQNNNKNEIGNPKI